MMSMGVVTACTDRVLKSGILPTPGHLPVVRSFTTLLRRSSQNGAPNDWRMGFSMGRSKLRDSVKPSCHKVR